MRTITISNIPAGAETQEIPISADYIRVKQAGGDIEIRASEDRVELQQGDEWIADRKIKSIAIKNISLNDQTVKLQVGNGRIGSMQVNGSVNVTLPSNIEGLAQVNIPAADNAMIAAANPNRKRLHIAADQDLMIGGNGSVGAALGAILWTGQQLAIENTGEIWAHNLAGAAVAVVSLLEESN